MSDTETPGVNPQIQKADGDGARDEKVRGNIRVHHGIEVMQKERAAISRHAATHLKPRFKRRERAPETKDFDDHAVHQRQRVARRTAADPA